MTQIPAWMAQQVATKSEWPESALRVLSTQPREGSEDPGSREDVGISPLLPGQEVRAAEVPWEPRCAHSLPPTPRTHRITITNFCLGKHLVSEGDLLKDQRGSPAYISPDVLSGRCGAQAEGPGQHTARGHCSLLLASPICGLPNGFGQCCPWGLVEEEDSSGYTKISAWQGRCLCM